MSKWNKTYKTYGTELLKQDSTAFLKQEITVQHCIRQTKSTALLNNTHSLAFE